MAENIVSLIAMPLLFQAPMLLVYLAAFVLALVYVRRTPLVAILTLVASVILLVASIAMPVLQSMLMRIRGPVHPVTFDLVVMAGSFARALGTGLLVAAIFVGRGRASSQV